MNGQTNERTNACNERDVVLINHFEVRQIDGETIRLFVYQKKKKKKTILELFKYPQFTISNVTKYLKSVNS